MIVCSVCLDSHKMLIHALSDQARLVLCTSCPRPCTACACDDGRGAYCAKTPCGCPCHVLPLEEVAIGMKVPKELNALTVKWLEEHSGSRIGGIISELVHRACTDGYVGPYEAGDEISKLQGRIKELEAIETGLRADKYDRGVEDNELIAFAQRLVVCKNTSEKP